MKDKLFDDPARRLEKIKELSMHLSNKYKKNEISMEKFSWLMKNLKDAINMAKSGACEDNFLLERLEDLVCAVDIEEQDEDYKKWVVIMVGNNILN